MKSYLDISKCSDVVKKPFMGIIRIPVRIGRHERDVDVIMQELNEDDREIVSKACGNYETASKEKPVGFDVKKLPDGAVLHIEAT